MRLILSSCLLLILAVPGARAQSVMQNLPPYAPMPDNGNVTVIQSDTVPAAPAAMPPAASIPAADPYTVADVNADVTADTAGHARDQALTQAEHMAFAQLCTRMNAPDSAAKINDDVLAGLVQSFEVQSEHLSAVRYIGVFTIRFKPLSTQRKLGKYAASVSENGASAVIGDDARTMPSGPISHVAVAVQTESLAAWAQIKRRLNNVSQVVRVDTIDLGRGISHMDLLYGGNIDDLQSAVTAQGFVLRQNGIGEWELYDNSMVPR
jgi:hypothetical protein